MQHPASSSARSSALRIRPARDSSRHPASSSATSSAIGVALALHFLLPHAVADWDRHQDRPFARAVQDAPERTKPIGKALIPARGQTSFWGSCARPHVMFGIWGSGRAGRAGSRHEDRPHPDSGWPHPGWANRTSTQPPGLLGTRHRPRRRARKSFPLRSPCQACPA